MIGRRIAWITVAAVTLALAAPAAMADRAQRVEDALWGGGVIWDTVGTPANFHKVPTTRSLDRLYSFSMSGLMGQRSVASNVPGDQEFNGGRWWVQMVVFTEAGLEVHDPDGDGYVNFELTSADEVLAHRDLGHLEIFPTMMYFECPMLRAN